MKKKKKKSIFCFNLDLFPALATWPSLTNVCTSTVGEAGQEQEEILGGTEKLPLSISVSHVSYTVNLHHKILHPFVCRK